MNAAYAVKLQNPVHLWDSMQTMQITKLFSNWTSAESQRPSWHLQACWSSCQCKEKNPDSACQLSSLDASKFDSFWWSTQRNQGIHLSSAHFITGTLQCQANWQSTKLYGCEAWTPYHCHIRIIDSFYMHCLKSILCIRW